MSKSAASDGREATNADESFTWVEIERLDGSLWHLYSDGSYCPAW